MGKQWQTVTPPKGAKRVAKASTKPTSRFVACAPKACLTCKQDTHAVDRDSSDNCPALLYWAKTGVDAAGQVYPKGNECYHCFDVRRTSITDSDHKGVVVPQATLLTKFGETPELETKFFFFAVLLCGRRSPIKPGSISTFSDIS